MCVEVQCAWSHGRQELLNATNQLGAARSRQQMTKEQTLTLDMIYMHQGWHRKCGLVMESLEQTQRSADYLCKAGYVTKREDGWYKILDKGLQALALWRSSLNKDK